MYICNRESGKLNLSVTIFGRLKFLDIKTLVCPVMKIN